MTMRAVDARPFVELNGDVRDTDPRYPDPRYPDRRWDDGPRPTDTESALQRFWNGTIDDFDPDASPDPFIPETPEETAERLARTPSSPEGNQQAPTLAFARLDVNAGIGILRLMRNAAGTPVRAHGTWRSDDGVLSLADSMAIGSSQRFCGVLYDDANEYPIDVNVTITGHGDYRDTQGRPLRLVRFVSPEAVERADPALWPATPPAFRVAQRS